MQQQNGEIPSSLFRIGENVTREKQQWDIFFVDSFCLVAIESRGEASVCGGCNGVMCCCC